MTDEERQNTIDFILEQQAEIAARVNRNQQQQEQATVEHNARLSTLEDLSKVLVENQATTREEHHARLSTLEDLSKMLVESQVETAEKVARVEKRDTEYEERIRRFERSYQSISRLLEAHDKQLVTVTKTLNDFVDGFNLHSQQMIEIRESLNETRQQLDRVTIVVNRLAERDDELASAMRELTTNVNRYIASLNNGSNN